MTPLADLPDITEPCELSEHDVHVWYCFYDDIREPGQFAQYDALMTDDERARHQRLHFERDRLMFLVTRALVRTTLSKYADCAPADWRFDKNEWGRPHVSGPVAAPHFNLSNTQGLVACAVARTEGVGVDVENITRRTEPTAIAHRFFSKSEAEALMSLPDEGRRARFFSLWTLKEAYIKARGMGLAIPLRQFSYSLGDGEIAISFGDKVDDDPSLWRFALTRASDEHYLSLAVDRPEARIYAAHVTPTVSGLAL